jgi:hypothetical protein
MEWQVDVFGTLSYPIPLMNISVTKPQGTACDAMDRQAETYFVSGQVYTLQKQNEAASSDTAEMCI